ncbi:50S ribosomal protein L13 [Patescibacteria group bacterium]
MDKNIENKITVDASGQALGRLATKLTLLLRGKDLPNWRPNVVVNRKIEVINLKDIKFTAKKGKELYYRHSGYPGGLKSISMKDLWNKDQESFLRKVVTAMLPTNRLRKQYMKNLIIISNDNNTEKDN